ncbi:hypothetical protein AJ88_03055 [Mesorhizobium amorphae CCBAU 01583]|nr:hypothetical protein AJ88_03055 [Mesorhizobium amorphae CCBAU 01583]
MKLSVSVVTFQQVDYIRQAVESTLRQETRFPIEVIVGDDASTDGTLEVLEDIHAGAPDRVKLLRAKSNYGDFGLSNVMATIDAAQGEYVAFSMAMTIGRTGSNCRGRSSSWMRTRNARFPPTGSSMSAKTERASFRSDLVWAMPSMTSTGC